MRRFGICEEKSCGIDRVIRARRSTRYPRLISMPPTAARLAGGSGCVVSISSVFSAYGSGFDSVRDQDSSSSQRP